MPDMLVKLYDLPALEHAIAKQRAMGVSIRRCMPPEKHLVLAWIREHFSEYWVSEADVGFSVHPTTVLLAHRGDQLLGFACYDTTQQKLLRADRRRRGRTGAGHWHGAAAGDAACHARRGLHVRHYRRRRPCRLL